MFVINRFGDEAWQMLGSRDFIAWLTGFLPAMDVGLCEPDELRQAGKLICTAASVCGWLSCYAPAAWGNPLCSDCNRTESPCAFADIVFSFVQYFGKLPQNESL
jgi:hypothetical protein